MKFIKITNNKPNDNKRSCLNHRCVLTGTSTLSQSGPGINGNEWLLHIL